MEFFFFFQLVCLIVFKCAGSQDSKVSIATCCGLEFESQ
jgi:hypothetical protein